MKREIDVDSPEKAEDSNVLGVDCNVNDHIAVTRPGQFIGNADYLNHQRCEFEKHRASLQQTGTRYAHLAYQRIGDKFGRWSRDYLHRASREIVAEAHRHGCTHIAFENLEQIRERISDDKKFQHWAFNALQTQVEYQAEEYDIVLGMVNPQYTSQQCSKCGCTLEENRDGQQFECLDLGLSVNELFEAIVNRPLAILPKLSGPFAVACYNARDGSLLAATDKLGTRDCYYAPTANGIAFSSELKTVLAQRDDVELDERAAADLLHFGHILGEKTLGEEISALPPASLLQYTNGDLSVQRYWQPDFGQAPVDRYVEQTADAYRQTIADVAATMEGEVGLYLSGGLDSRLLAATLRDEYGPFRTLTYDGNPTDGSNPRLARRVAEQLEIENHVVDRTPGEFGPLVQKGMNITDGMISWEYFTNPNFVFNNLHDRVDLVLEGAPQGELFGEQIWLSDFQHGSSVTEVILRRLGDLSRETVTSLLNVSIDPADSVRAEVGKVDRREFQHRMMDVWLRNLCSNIHFRSSKLERSQAGTRIPFASTDLLNAVAQMPHQAYRRDTVPFSGTIPRSMAPLKRKLILHRDDELKDIRYERTSLLPARPLWLHDGMYLAKQTWRELVAGRPTPVADWSRDHAPMTQAINRWLDRAGERALFDEEAIRRIQREHFRAEANHIRAIARITTLELWMEKYLDGNVQPRAERMTMD